MSPRKGNYPGRKPGATKKNPEAARALLKAGYSIAEVAGELGIHERTVRRYIKNGARSV